MAVGNDRNGASAQSLAFGKRRRPTSCDNDNRTKDQGQLELLYSPPIDCERSILGNRR